MKRIVVFIFAIAFLFSTFSANAGSRRADNFEANESFVNKEQAVTPSNPAAGKQKLYFKTDGNLYRLNSSGSESAIGASAGAGDDVSVDGVSLADPDFISTGDVDFVNSANSVTGNLNTDSVGEPALDEAMDFNPTGFWNHENGNFAPPSSTTLPGTCSVGQIYFDTNATAGSNVFGCTAVNTWTLQGGGGGGGGSFRGALVRLSNNANTTSGSTNFLNFSDSVSVYDTDSIVQNDLGVAALVVPAGVTKIRLTAQVEFAANSTGTRNLRMDIDPSGTLTGLGWMEVVPAPSPATTNFNITSAVIEVVAGNAYRLVFGQTSGGNLNVLSGTNGGTWFAMQIIE